VKKTLTVAGRNIALDDLPADHDPAGVPIVLVHGANVNRTIWESVVERVRGTRRVVVVDMPGHGESPGPAPTKVDEWADILAGLNSQLGLGPSIIVGHSLGGAATQAYYTKHPDHFVAIGLISTTPSFGMDHDMVQRWLDDPETHKAEELMIIASHAGDDFKNRLVELRSLNGQESIANDLRAIEGWDTAGQPISVPAIVVTASNDFVPIREACAHWRDTLPQVTYFDFEGPGHHMMLEAPGETAEAIGNWVDGLGV
jgi:pimeloyl-ACP methyl ester carboxylesterase